MKLKIDFEASSVHLSARGLCCCPKQATLSVVALGSSLHALVMHTNRLIYGSLALHRIFH